MKSLGLDQQLYKKILAGKGCPKDQDNCTVLHCNDCILQPCMLNMNLSHPCRTLNHRPR